MRRRNVWRISSGSWWWMTRCRLRRPPPRNSPTARGRPSGRKSPPCPSRDKRRTVEVYAFYSATALREACSNSNSRRGNRRSGSFVPFPAGCLSPATAPQVTRGQYGYAPEACSRHTCCWMTTPEFAGSGRGRLASTYRTTPTRDFRRALGAFRGETGLSRSSVSLANETLKETLSAQRKQVLVKVFYAASLEEALSQMEAFAGVQFPPTFWHAISLSPGRLRRPFSCHLPPSLSVRSQMA